MIEQSDFPAARPLVGKLFPVNNFSWGEGLRDEVVSACGDPNAFGFAMGKTIFDHSCGLWGSVSDEERRLNQHVLDGWIGGKPTGRWVVSLHIVAGVPVEINSNLATGETRIRRPSRLRLALATGEAGSGDR